jgi:hypothetical protein
MSDLLRRFRGLGIAFVVLTLSAGAVFATSVGLPVSHQTEPVANTESASDDPGEAAESEEASGDPAAASEEPSDNHGALVSTAAQMPTPSGFPNHGAFVSCVAHMKDVAATGFDWTTVTPESCEVTPDTQTQADAGKAKGAEGKAKGQAKRAAAAQRAGR